jgi:hypothetical protein
MRTFKIRFFYLLKESYLPAAISIFPVIILACFFHPYKDIYSWLGFMLKVISFLAVCTFLFLVIGTSKKERSDLKSFIFTLLNKLGFKREKIPDKAKVSF